MNLRLLTLLLTFAILPSLARAAAPSVSAPDDDSAHVMVIACGSTITWSSPTVSVQGWGSTEASALADAYRKLEDKLKPKSTHTCQTCSTDGCDMKVSFLGGNLPVPQKVYPATYSFILTFSGTYLVTCTPCGDGGGSGGAGGGGGEIECGEAEFRTPSQPITTKLTLTAVPDNIEHAVAEAMKKKLCQLEDKSCAACQTGQPCDKEITFFGAQPVVTSVVSDGGIPVLCISFSGQYLLRCEPCSG